MLLLPATGLTLCPPQGLPPPASQPAVGRMVCPSPGSRWALGLYRAEAKL